MADFVAKLKDQGAKCAASEGAQPGDVDTLLSHKVPESHEGKCVMFCLHKSFGIEKEDGSWSVESAVAYIEPLKAEDQEMYDKVRKIAVTCSTEVAKDADPCITAVNIGQCWVREGKAFGITADLFEKELL